jgi:5-methylcytosine-specific restriction endonuclease McrA
MPRTIEEIRKAKREHMARRRAVNPQAVRDYQNAYHARNRTVQKQKMRNYYARRFFWGRAMKLRGEGRATYKELAALWRRQRGRCALTGNRLDRTAQLDHILPKARGGGDTVANLRWVTLKVNLAKRDMTDAEFAVLCESVMRWIGERIAKVDAK